MASKTPTADDIEREYAEYRKRMNARLAPAWMPTPGSTIKATVVKLNMATGGEYDAYPVVTYEVLYSAGPTTVDVGSVVSVHAFHTLLRERLAELGTVLGKVQWLTYEGRQASRKRVDSKGDPVQYHVYDVENDGELPTVKEDVPFAF